MNENAKVLATVGTLTVTDLEVEEFLLSLGQRGQMYNNPEGRKLMLDQLVGNKLLLLDARRNLLEADPEFKAQLNRLRESLLINFAGSKVIDAVKVSDEEIKEYYDANPEQFTQGKSVNASHILVDTEEKALELIKELEGGADFAELAREHSSCPSKEQGGSLGDFSEGQMVPEFDKAVFAMEVGEVTKTPVQTQFGYHLIKLNAKTEERVAELDTVKSQIGDMLLNEKRRKAYESKINQLKLLYPVDYING